MGASFAHVRQSSQFMSPTSVTTPSGSRRRNFTEDQIASYARNLEDVMNLIPTLQFGLDVNVRFDSPYSFELTPSLLVFDIFNVALCHGWVIDPQDRETYQVIAAELGSYNNVVEAVIASEVAESKLGVSGEADAEKRIRNGIVCKTFLDASASQLTYYGLGLLVETLPPHSLSVLFRNNHFSVVFKKGDNELYTLVTDHGFLNSSQIVWESLQNIENDSYFLDGLFRKYQPTEQQDSMENYPELHQSVLETNAPQGMSDEE
ncbi:Ubiquitin carboxyl-terminal hydrolase MINDY-1 [Nowakowskiella sp. JEL0407]|nr:Ubiquitin carboxyl-terminal hydrolase MINDY-1 [Nowakowskiella sp. JEL0407]